MPVVGEDANPVAAVRESAVSEPQPLASVVVVRSDDADEASKPMAGMTLAATKADGLGVVPEEVRSGIYEPEFQPLLPPARDGAEDMHLGLGLRLRGGRAPCRSGRSCYDEARESHQQENRPTTHFVDVSAVPGVLRIARREAASSRFASSTPSAG